MPDNLDNAPITPNTILKWGGALATVLTFFVSSLFYSWDTRGMAVQNAIDTKAVDADSKSRDDRHDKELIEVRAGTSEHQKLLIELLRKSDVLAQKVDELGKKIDGKGTN